MRKILVSLISLITILGFAGTAFAYNPTLSMTSTGSADSIQVNVSGGSPSASVVLYYTKANTGTTLSYIGTTDSSGALSTVISANTYAAATSSPAYVTVGGTQSASITWPATSGSGLFALSQTGLVLSVGQSSTITANNSSGNVYLSNNSNPPIANINISGTQISITGLSTGSTVVSVCSGNSSTCASAYITVGNSSTQSLTFSISTVTVAPGQSVPITISGGTGNYTVFNNSNSSVIQAGVNGSVVTLTTNSTSGTAAITICSSDMSSCGIINATAGTASSSPVAFSQNNPTMGVGQSVTVTISGGYPSGGSSASYYISTNSNSSAVQATVAGSNLSLVGSANGSSTITICSSAGSCGTLTATVSFSSTGGSLQLGQSNISLLVGQVLSVTVSGASTPYNLSGGNTAVAQTSLNGNVISVSGIGAGSSSVSVCSAGGACLPLSIIVNASGAGGTQMAITPNSVNVATGGSSSVVLSGAGGYYLSTNSNPAVASMQISGSTAVVSGLTSGNTNMSVCQSGGQCAILFVSVGGGSTNTNLPTFSQTNPSLSVGQAITITVSGGAGSSYYILTNTAPSVVQLSLNNNILSLTGLATGTTTSVICATTSSCASLNVTVGSTSTSALNVQGGTLSAATVGQPYSTFLSATGGSGSYTFTLSNGSLPAGLTLASNGLISGSPTAAGTANFTLAIADTANNSTTSNFSIVVSTSSTSIPVPTPTPTIGTTASPSNLSNGQLIIENGTIYIVYLNTKVGFANANAFLGLGFTFKNVTPVTNSGLSVSPKVVTSAIGHPRGTWLLSGKTIYFLTPTGLIPVPTWDIFTSNGGQASYIVKANAQDLTFAKLPLMTANDSRLQP